MRYLGLDVGDRRIGLAVSDPRGIIATPYKVYTRTTDEHEDINAISAIAEDIKAGALVLGMPRNMNGSYGPRAEIVREFAESLKTVIKLPIHFFDERLTTVSAERMLIGADLSRKKRKQVIDKLAAQLILQGFLDYHSE